MSAISLKSITGITSITTPAGVDNQLTLHTNNTTERVKINSSGNVSIANDLDVDGHTNLDNVSIAGVTTTSDNIFIQADNKYLSIGAHNDGDMLLYHDGNKSVLVNYTGDFHIRTNNGSRSSLEGIILKPNGATEIYHNGTKKLETFSAGISVTGQVNSDGSHMGDGDKALFGNSNDLQIFHDGNNSFINDTGTGALILDGSKIRLRLSGSGTQFETDTNGIIATGTAHRFQSGTSGDCELIIEADTDNNAELDNPRILFRQDGGNDWSAIGTNDNTLEISNSVSGGGGISLKTGTTNGYTNATERLRINSSGQLLVGGVTDARTVLTSYTPRLQIEGIDKSSTSASITANMNNTVGPSFWFAKTRGTSIGSNTAAQSDDELGTIVFNGADGTDVQTMGAYIRGTVDGSVSSNNVPGRLQFHTASGGTMYERLRIDSSGRLLLGTTTEGHSNADNLTVADTGNSGITIRSGTSSGGTIYFSDGTSGADEYRGVVTYNHASNYMAFWTNGDSEKVRIDSSGRLLLGTTTEGSTEADDLTIATSGHTGITLRSGTTHEGNIFFSDGTSGADQYRGLIRYDHDGDKMIFGTGDGTERLRIASNGFVGIGEDDPQTELNTIGTISTGRNIARELGTIINISSNHNVPRSGGNVINGNKNFENGNNDWLAQGGSRVNANLTIDLGGTYSCDRFVIYNQNEYSHSNREVKNFTLEGSNDNSNWTTVLDDDCGCSHGHEPNPGFSFRIPQGFNDDNEGNSFRYWRFTMKTFHGSDSYGGVTELELYQAGTSSNVNATGSEITTHSLVASDVHSQTIDGLVRIGGSKGLNFFTGEDASDTWEITETGIITNGSYQDKSTIRHKRGVMAVSSAYNTGDLFIRIDNLYNLPGNAWWTAGATIISTEVVGTLAGHHSYVTSLDFTALSSWSGVTKTDIVGSMNVSVSSHGSNFIELFVNVNDSSRGPCIVIATGPFDPPRISFH